MHQADFNRKRKPRLRSYVPIVAMGAVITPPAARLCRATFRRQQADAARHRLAYRRETSNRAWVSLVVDEDILNALARWEYLPKEAANASKKNAELIAAAILAMIRQSMADE